MNQTINGKTKVLGLIGNPVEHTLSPIIHNSLSKELGINCVYVPFHVPHGELDKAIAGGKSLNLQGLNVTVPYKVDVMDFLIEITPFAEQIGAVNTLKFTDNGYIGYNTDAEGLGMSLKKNEIELRNSDVVIIGAGGAAKAVAVLCAKEKVSSITIINRTLSKAEQLSDNIKKFYDLPINVIGYDQVNQLQEFDIAFQTTSIGMSPDIHKNPVEDEAFYKKFHSAVDLIYNPEKTLFLKKAETNGAKIVNGFEMLYYQGVRAFEIWNNLLIDEKILDKVFLQLLEYKKNK